MPPLSLLIKPASSSCNMRCIYCFYHSIAESRMTASYGVMGADTLEILVRNAMDYAENSCTFAFQGGEPTLAGLEYYKNLVSIVKQYNGKRIKVNYAIQTNGLAINDEWAGFLSENRFLAGVSLDGPRDIHEAARPDTAGKGTFGRVMDAIALLKRYSVDYNILCVVTSNTARHIKQIYDFYKKNDFRYLQFIPCLDPLEEKPGGRKYSLTAEKYGLFLKKLFDEWYSDMITGRKISIRYFDNLLGMLLGYPPEACGMAGECAVHFVVEADGSVYPCDFYVFDRWRLGNVRDSGLEEMAKSVAAREFVTSSRYEDQKCSVCKWHNICRGGCRRNREPFIDGLPAPNYYCSAYMEFFEYAAGRLTRLAGML